MKRIQAQFKPVWQPSKSVWAFVVALSVLALCSVLLAAWERRSVAMTRSAIAALELERVSNFKPVAPQLPPVYAASARRMLKERSSGWAPMLRTLESASMIGVTPTSVDFDATTGDARVTLIYSDASALIEYLERANEGVSPAPGIVRWSLLESRSQTANSTAGGSPTVAAGESSMATIHSNWNDTENR